MKKDVQAHEHDKAVASRLAREYAHYDVEHKPSRDPDSRTTFSDYHQKRDDSGYYKYHNGFFF